MTAQTQAIEEQAITRSELIPCVLIATVIASAAVPAFAAGSRSIGFAILAAALFSLWGLLAVTLRRVTTWLWAAIGVNLLGALGMIWLFGGTFGLGAALMAVYGIATARRMGIPAITWRGVLAECAGFCGPILIFWTLEHV